jgi:hypothetical protein
MPGNSGQSASHSPAAIAIHDDCHVQSFKVIALHCKVTSRKLPCSLGVRQLFLGSYSKLTGEPRRTLLHHLVGDLLNRIRI